MCVCDTEGLGWWDERGDEKYKKDASKHGA